MKKRRDPTASAIASQRSNLVGERVDEAKSEELGPSFVYLPSAITTNIMLQLPIKSLLICRCVCTTWNTLISDPQFAKSHFERAPVSVMIRTDDPDQVSRTLHLLEYEPQKFANDGKETQECWCEDDYLKPECNNHVRLEPTCKLPLRDAKLVLDKSDETENGSRERSYIARKPEHDKFAVVNSCNGLLCLCHPYNNNPLVVCNPVTGEFIRLPKASKTEKTQQRYMYSGFGFQPKTNEYKVIKMWKRYIPRYCRRLDFMGQVVEMHTLGTSTWINIGVDPTFLIDKLEFPTYMNGALHWIRFDASKWSILCFSFESERFQNFPCPPHAFESNALYDTHVSMGELRGFLCICEESSCDSVIIWVMEKYGIAESWTKVFNIDISEENRWTRWARVFDGLYWPVKEFKTGNGILMYHCHNQFIYYESGMYGFKFFQVRGTKSKFEVVPHILSLVSLKDVVKGDNVEVLNVQSRCARFKLQEENKILFLAPKNDQLEIVSPSSSSSSDGEEYTRW